MVFISSISCFQLATNEDRQLRMHLSRRLLRVRSSDRYQNEATELLFLFLSNVFVFVFVCGLQSSKSAKETGQNASFSQSDPTWIHTFRRIKCRNNVIMQIVHRLQGGTPTKLSQFNFGVHRVDIRISLSQRLKNLGFDTCT